METVYAARYIHPMQNSSVIIIIPVFNDWEAARLLLGQISETAGREQLSLSVLLVNDGSIEGPPPGFGRVATLPNLAEIRVMNLRGNLGHQRAIAIGVTHVAVNWPCRHIVVMDGDGEDSPDDVPRLLKRAIAEGDRKVVFAERVRRSENLRFRAGYQIYRFLHGLLTGHKVRVGNFSVVPHVLLNRLVIQADLWNHYAATIFKSRTPHVMEPCPRAKRLEGQSRMNYIALVIHGLSAMAVFADRVGVRLLIANMILIMLVLGAMAAVVGVRFGTDLAVPVWATTAFGHLANLLFTSIGLSIAFLFIILGSRSAAGFLPIRDYQYYIAEVITLMPGDS
ncbi:glycosyltransferase [Zavarzinella formosa]|uniref:glycosyltransferase n=1 Tax=Zavarzinella formosa TaxID=360055 RepID=UPI000307CB07|nr:glycosyltransferase [Zavarzinella formosa]